LRDDVTEEEPVRRHLFNPLKNRSMTNSGCFGVRSVLNRHVNDQPESIRRLPAFFTYCRLEYFGQKTIFVLKLCLQL
jgi:hypothetical protein